MKFYQKNNLVVAVKEINNGIAKYQKVKTYTYSNGLIVMKKVMSGYHYKKSHEFNNWYFCGEYHTLD
jgi:hypothetical protein